MPQPKRKRGRRGDARPSRTSQADSGELPHKRRKFSNEEGPDYAVPDLVPLGMDSEYASGEAQEPVEMTFFGLLDESEQEYFRQADTQLANNLFDDDEDRALFLANVYREANGKELKMACSQSSSRLLERLISLSNTEQLQALFQKFASQFVTLAQHRFASHCCEALFIHSAPLVTQEMQISQYGSRRKSSKEHNTSVEDCILAAVNELQGSLGFLMTDQFASHSIRALLLVLSGQPITSRAHASLLRSKRKEGHDVQKNDGTKEMLLDQRAVPESFRLALETMIRDTALSLDTNGLRALATHATGNPTMQLLLKLELTHFGKQYAKESNSIYQRLLPDNPPTRDTASWAFLDTLTFDSVGSHLLETIISHSPGKLFKVLYKESWKYRMGSMSRNEVAGYIAITILKRLNMEDLREAIQDILPHIPSLAERGRTAIIKTMIECSAIRGLDTNSLAVAIASAYHDDASPPTFSIVKMLNPVSPAEPTLDVANIGPLTGSNAMSTEEQQPSNPQAGLHASLLAQAMLAVPGPLSELISNALQSLQSRVCVELAKQPHASHVLQAAFSGPSATTIARRKLIQHFYSHIGELALHPSGSHMVDTIWHGTHPGLAFMRERCAEELAENETSLRNSSYGRAVWRNWKMDLYKRNRGRWAKQVVEECGNGGFLSFPADDSTRSDEYARPGSEDIATTRRYSERARGRSAALKPVRKFPSHTNADAAATGKGTKTSLQLARERFARQQQRKNDRRDTALRQQDGKMAKKE